MTEIHFDIKNNKCYFDRGASFSISWLFLFHPDKFHLKIGIGWWRENCIYYRKSIIFLRIVLISCCCCNMLAQTAWNNTNLLSYSSAGRRSENQCVIRAVFLLEALGESFYLPSLASGGHLHALAHGAFLVSLQLLFPSHLCWVTLTLLSLSHKDLCNYIGPPGSSRIISHLKILNLVPSAKSLFRERWHALSSRT